MRSVLVPLGAAALLACAPPERRSNGSSPQGIDGNADDRRDDARNDRDDDDDNDGQEEFTSDGRAVRTFDGSGNNLRQPEWGASFTHLVRLAAADYGDGISTMAGADRPNPRLISNGLVHQGESDSTVNVFDGSDYVWQWGQFIDHDVGLTDGNGAAVPISVPAGDEWFDPRGSGAVVIPFSRALHDPATGVTSPREQENEITAWIDGSMVYGSSEERAEALRDDDSPRLRTSNGDLLPFNRDELLNANGFVSDPRDLFLAGDVRANEQVGLAAMHTLFVREHNRWVDELGRDGDDEERFQRARRLVVAEIQQITYVEWLPALLGPGAVSAYDGYEDTVNPGLFNEFSVAAFRLGHSMVNEQLIRIDDDGDPLRGGAVSLRDAFFNAPEYLDRRDDLDPFLRGMAMQAHQPLDGLVVESLRNFLFGPPGAGGLDLVALNIQRGRDHGVPGYNDMREAMGLSRATSFADVTSDRTLQRDLAAVYDDVDQVDLWIGGLAEDPLISAGSQVGPLFRAIVATQFEALRDGDRFWYERDLTADELATVRGRTLADVIRDNSGVGQEISDDVFHVP